MTASSQGSSIVVKPGMSKRAFAELCAQYGHSADVVDLHGNPNVGDDWLETLAALHPRKIILSGTRVGDAGLEFLANLADNWRDELTAIYIAETGVTVAGLKYLLAFPHLETVFVTDNGIPNNHPTVEALRQHIASHFQGNPGRYEGVVIDWGHERELSCMY